CERAGETEPIADQVETFLEEQLDGLNAVEPTPELTDRVESSIDVVERTERDHHEFGTRHESETRGGDDGERALAPAEQARAVVALLALHQPVEGLLDAPVCEYRFDADTLSPRGAVTQHVHAARVRRDHAAHGRGVARREIDAVLPARGGRVRLQSG